MRRDLPRPTDAELRVLRILWQLGPSTVREVYRTLQDRELDAVGYTTVLKSMQIMTDKGLLLRDETRRPQVYRPAIPREQTEGQLLGRIMDGLFGGSAARLAMRALNTREVSDEELEELRALLRRLQEEADR